MPTVISHSIVGAGIASFFKSANRKKLIIAAVLLGALPDFDTILMGIFGRDSIFRHREFMHSFFFAGMAGMATAFLFRKKNWIPKEKFWLSALLFFIVTASHPCLDGFSTGFRHGVAYLAPFDNYRYFLWMSPLPLAPLSPEHLFSMRGLNLFLVEAGMLWTFGFGALLWNKMNRKSYMRPLAVILWITCLIFWITRATNS